MDNEKTGALIRKFRLNIGLTQKQLADKMNISDKAISKWERGIGLPDISLLVELSDILGINIDDLLLGEINENGIVGGNMKNTKFYVCPICGNISLCTGNASITCCGRKLEALEAKKADENNKLTVEQVENDWYITSTHPMEKDNYISFVAFATGGKIDLIKQYPEWNLQVRIQRHGHGKLIWYSTKEGLMYQLI